MAYDRTLGARAHRRLKESESYEELMLLSECDRAGRVPGAVAPELEEALEYATRLRSTTPETIREAARRFLDGERAVVTTVGPALAQARSGAGMVPSPGGTRGVA